MTTTSFTASSPGDLGLHAFALGAIAFFACVPLGLHATGEALSVTTTNTKPIIQGPHLYTEHPIQLITCKPKIPASKTGTGVKNSNGTGKNDLDNKVTVAYQGYYQADGDGALELSNNPADNAVSVTITQNPPATKKTALSGPAARGKAIFENKCSVCHNADSDTKKVGPGLKGIFKRGTFTTNGNKVTDQSLKTWVENGDTLMPPFKGVLDSDQMKDLIAYVKTL
jgi:cytochrome c